MSMLARAVAPRSDGLKTSRVTVSEDGTYVTGPSLDAIAPWLGPQWAGATPETALNLITIYQCVRVLSNTFSQIPLMLYRRLPNGGKERATDHPLYRTLHTQPNEDLTSFAWRRLLMIHVATWGDHFAEKVRNSFGETNLYPIRPDRIEVSREDGVKVYDYLHPDGGTKRRMRRGTILQISGLSTNGLRGRSPISDLRSTIEQARNTESFGTAFFRNGARPGVILKHPSTLSDAAQGRLAAQVDGMRGPANAGRTVVLEEGLDFAEVGVPPEDAQYIQTRLLSKRELAGAYGIPLHMIGDLERATFSNIEHQGLELITVTMMPYFVNTEQELGIQLIDDDEYFAEFLVDGYLRGDSKARNEAYAIRWQHGTLNADEWRIKENDNPIPDGTGQTYYVPMNYQPAVLPGAAAEPEDATEDEAAIEGDGIVDDETMAPLLTVIKSAEVRCGGAFRGTSCGRLLAEVATAPYRFVCPKCKTTTEQSS